MLFDQQNWTLVFLICIDGVLTHEVQWVQPQSCVWRAWIEEARWLNAGGRHRRHFWLGGVLLLSARSLSGTSNRHWTKRVQQEDGGLQSERTKTRSIGLKEGERSGQVGAAPRLPPPARHPPTLNCMLDAKPITRHGIGEFIFSQQSRCSSDALCHSFHLISHFLHSSREAFSLGSWPFNWIKRARRAISTTSASRHRGCQLEIWRDNYYRSGCRAPLLCESRSLLPCEEEQRSHDFWRRLWRPAGWLIFCNFKESASFY